MVHRVLIVGAGGHATNSWRGAINIHEDFEPSAIVDTNPEVLEKTPTTWGIDGDCVAYTIDEAVAYGLAKKGDIALICTPIDTHATLCFEAMEYGMHVICERHMTDEFEDLGIQTKPELAKLLLDTVSQGELVGHDPNLERWFYRITINGEPQYIAIGIGSNGFIVTARRSNAVEVADFPL